MRTFFRTNRTLLRRMFVAIMLLLFSFSIFKLVEYQWLSNSNDQFYAEVRQEKSTVAPANKDAVSTPTPAPDPAPAPAPVPAPDSKNDSERRKATAAPTKKDGFARLLKRNPDTVGWLSIPGTRVDYPVVQAKDNDYYLKRNFDRKASAWGSIFMDFRNVIENNERHTIVYGHHMNDGSMFAAITRYAKPEFFQRNRFILLDTPTASLKWEVFSAYETTTDFYYIQTVFRSKRDYADFLDSLSARSVVDSGVQLSANDQILTLSTCTRADDDRRFVVHARKLKVSSN